MIFNRSCYSWGPSANLSEQDVLPGLAARNDACIKINVLIFHSLNGVRREVCRWLCKTGFRHGFVRRNDALSIEVVIVVPIGIFTDLTLLSVYFGSS
jgi:hypothetical protein